MALENAITPRSPGRSVRRTKTFLKALLTLAILYTLYLAKTLLLPIVVAALLALFCNPLVVSLHRHYIPRVVAALSVMVIIMAMLASVITLLAQPAEKWIAAIPYATAEVGEQLDEVAGQSKVTVPDAAEPDEDDERNLSTQIRDRFFATALNFALNSTPVLLTQILAVVILVYFFLVYGEGLLRRLVQIRPGMTEKRAAVLIVRTIQTDVSHYILVVAVINAGLGVATALALWTLGVRDPVLWGAMATLLNFAPYLGPFVMTLTLTFVGLIQFGITGYALFVPAAFLTLNLIECQLVTPTALGKRLHLNPLVVFLWLILWGWMWGAAGMLIGVPLLVCVKIIATNLHSFDPWIRMLEK